MRRIGIPVVLAWAATLAVLSGRNLIGFFGEPSETDPVVIASFGAGWEEADEIIPTDVAVGATLTITPVDTRLNPTPIEGYVTFVRLQDSDGAVVMDQRTGESLTHVLPAGEYRLLAYLRTCDGSCGYLDPPQDVCSLDVSLTSGMSYQVEASMQGKRCTLL